MGIVLLIIFLHISSIQTTDYNLDNQQICTHKPFKVNSPHNCSRIRLIPDINVGNNDQILSISIVFQTTSSTNTSLSITKSSGYNQTVYLTFFTFLERSLFINNKTLIPLPNTTITSYVYQTGSDQIARLIDPITIPSAYLSKNPYCLLRQLNLTLSSGFSRAYYLFTNESGLNLDLSVSSNQISPLFNGINGLCFKTISTLSALGIILIVIISVLSLTTVICAGMFLNRQLRQLWILFRNRLNKLHGLTPTVIIDN